MKLNHIPLVILMLTTLIGCSNEIQVEDAKCYSGDQLIYSDKIANKVWYVSQTEIFGKTQERFFTFKDVNGKYIQIKAVCVFIRRPSK